MELGYVFCWVDDVRNEARFYADGLGVKPRVLEEVPGHGWRAELETGATTLYVADSRELGGPGEISADAYRNDAAKPPAAFQVTFVTDDVPGAFGRAMEHGSAELAAPYQTPWGQTLARLRTPGGVVVSLASPPPSRG
jgi:uncharacterized glyoxalase superfamily protein PhnB